MPSSYVAKRARELNLKIVDAKEGLDIEVLPRDVANSIRKNSKCCAFSTAAKRQFKGVKNAYFFRSTAYLEYDDKLIRFHLPTSMQKEIVSFDRTFVMMAGSYRLSGIKPSHRLGERHADKRKGRHTPTNGGKRLAKHVTQGIRTFFQPNV